MMIGCPLSLARLMSSALFVFSLVISLPYQPERSTSSTLVDFGIVNMKALIIL